MSARTRVSAQHAPGGWLGGAAAPIVLIAPLVALVPIAVKGAAGELRHAWRIMPGVLSREISRSLGAPIVLRSIEVQGRTIRVEGVSLSDPSRPGAPEPMLRVDRAAFEVPPDIWSRLTTDGPLVDHVRIDGAVARLRRSAGGDWNFAALLRSKPGPAGRRWIETVAVERARVELIDSAMLVHPDRPNRPVRAVASDLSGELVFDRPDVLQWSANARLSGGPVATFGTYDGLHGRLLVGASGHRVAIPAWCSRFLPQSVLAAGGVASGRVLLLAHTAAPASAPVEWHAQGSVEGARLRLPWVRDAVTVRAAQVVASRAGVDASGVCEVSDQVLSVRTAVADFTRPRIDVRITGNGLNLLRVAHQAMLLGDADLPAGLKATGGGEVRLVGAPDRLWLQGAIDARLQGSIGSDAVTVSGARARAWLAGPLAAPEIRLAAEHATIRAGALEAVIRSAHGVWSHQTFVLRGSGSAAGGRFELMGTGQTGATASPFRAVLRARHVQAQRLLSAFPAATHAIDAAKATLAKVSDVRSPVAGIAGVDVSLQGDLRGRTARARYLVQVSQPRLYSVEADRLEVSGSMTSGLLAFDHAVVTRGRALVAAAGEVSTTSQTARLDLEVDGWPIGDLAPLWSDASDVQVKGRLYVRDGRIEGSLLQPRVRGTVYGRALTIGDFETDYAIASVEGGPSGILVDGEVFRLPSAALFHGVVRRPFGGAPSASIGCALSDIDLTEVPGVADLPYEVTGSVGADILMQISRNGITATSVRAESQRVWVGDVLLEEIEANASADGLSGPWYVQDARLRIGGGAVTASGLWSPEGDFAATGQIHDVPIADLGSAALRVGSVAGSLSGSVSLQGRTEPHAPLRLYGAASASIGELKLNGEDLGDATGRVVMDGNRVTSGTGGVLAEVASDGMRVSVGDATYDLDSRRLDATVRAESIDVARLRRAIERMPVALVPNSWASRVSEALQPVSGPIDAEGRVSGVVDDLAVAATLKTTGLVVADELTLSAEIEAEVDRTRADVRSLSVTSGEMVCSGSGVLRYGDRLDCRLEAGSVPVSLLSRWAPIGSPLRDLSGTIDTLAIEAEGSPEGPTVSAFAAARGIAWRGASAPPSSAPTVSFSALRLSGATIADGRARVDDLAVAVSAPSSGLDSSASLELHLSGSAPFSWQAPMLPPDAPIDIAVRCPTQGLGPIVAGTSVRADGEVQADLKLTGPSEQVLRMLASEEGDTSQVSVGGTASLRASQLSVAGLSASLADIDLALTLKDRMLWLGSGASDGVVARVSSRRDTAGKRPWTPGEVRLSGAIPLVDGDTTPEPLTLTATGVRLDESPLPGMNSGRLVGELALPGLNKAGIAPAVGARLTVTGSVAAPRIAGELGVRNVSLRLPSDEIVKSRAPRLAVNPTFDLSVHAMDHVFVSTTQMSAEVHTPTGQPIRLAGSLAEPRLAGRLAVDGGSLVFPTARFEIQRGGLVDIRYPGPGSAVGAEAGMDVSVDMTAVSRLSAVSVTGVPRRYTVTVEARGPILDSGASVVGLPGGGASRLRLTYRSSPPDLALSQSGLANRITALLGGEDALQAVFGRRSDAGQVLVGKFVDFVGGAIVPGLFDRTGLAESLGMDQLSVDYSRAGAFTLRLARDLGGPFQAEYSRRLAGASDVMGDTRAWEFRLGMRVKRGFRLTWSIDDQRTNAYLFEGVYSF